MSNITITTDDTYFGEPGKTYLVGTARAGVFEFNRDAMHAGFAFSLLCMAVGVDNSGLFGAIFIVEDSSDATMKECKRRLVEEVPNSGTSDLGPVYVTQLAPFDTLNNTERAKRIGQELVEMVARFERTDGRKPD